MINRIETNKLMSEFGIMSELASDWERDGLGTWSFFEHPSHKKLGVIIAAPKNNISESGCSVFFSKGCGY
jgi:hypothetical protein